MPFPVTAALIAWCVVVLGAVVCLIWAIVAVARKRAAATSAACLWCLVGGFTLSSALWSWMTTTNLAYQQGHMARLPPETLANDVDLPLMGMQVFFVHLDHLGRRFSYLTILIPLLGSILILRRAGPANPAFEEPKPMPDDDLFSPHG